MLPNMVKTRRGSIIDMECRSTLTKMYQNQKFVYDRNEIKRKSSAVLIKETNKTKHIYEISCVH